MQAAYARLEEFETVCTNVEHRDAKITHQFNDELLAYRSRLVALASAQSGLNEYASGRFEYFGFLVQERIHEFCRDRVEINDRVDALQKFIDQYELQGEPGAGVPATPDSDFSPFERHEMSLHRAAVKERQVLDWIAELSSMGDLACQTLRRRDMDSMFAHGTALADKCDAVGIGECFLAF